MTPSVRPVIPAFPISPARVIRTILAERASRSKPLFLPRFMQARLNNQTMQEVSRGGLTSGPPDGSFGGQRGPLAVQSRLVWIVSHLAELTIFFGAAAALGAGLLGLR